MKFVIIVVVEMENKMSTHYFVVNDDIVVAHCPSCEIASAVSCSLVIPHQKYRLTVSVDEERGIRVIGGCSSNVNSYSDAIASVKIFLVERLKPKQYHVGTSGLIGMTFQYKRCLGDDTRLYKVFRRVGGGTSPEGTGDLLECIEIQEGEYQDWQYFTSIKVVLYESALRLLIEQSKISSLA
jgi:hypothetical protein